MKENNTNFDNQDNKQHKKIRKKIEKKRERKKDIKKMKAIKKKMRNEIESKINTKDKFIKKEEKLKKYIQMFISNFEDEKEDLINVFKSLDKGSEVDIDNLENIQVKLILKKVFKYFGVLENEEKLYYKPKEIKSKLINNLQAIIEEIENNDNLIFEKEITGKKRITLETNHEFIVNKNSRNSEKLSFKIEEKDFEKSMLKIINQPKIEKVHFINNKNEEKKIEKIYDDYNKINNRTEPLLKKEDISKNENIEIFKIMNNSNLYNKFEEGKFKNSFI